MTEPLVGGRCAKRVYRHHCRHQCTRAAAYPVDAPMYCKQHDPQTIAQIEAKNKQQEENQQAYRTNQWKIECASKEVVIAAMAWHARESSLENLVVTLVRLTEAKAALTPEGKTRE